MKLNIRLSGVIFGLLSITVIGRFLLYSGRPRYRTFSLKSNNKKGSDPTPLIGLALIIIGYIGVFIGNLIKATINRQREYLADASAVQFTRNPEGIGGALKKIYSFSKKSNVKHHNATAYNHLFLGEISQPLFRTFATHPPLEKKD